MTHITNQLPAELQKQDIIETVAIMLFSREQLVKDPELDAGEEWLKLPSIQVNFYLRKAAMEINRLFSSGI